MIFFKPKSKIQNPKWKGFTLIELLVVVAIIAVLIAILLFGLAGWFGFRSVGGEHILARVPIPTPAPEKLPDTPGEWRGRIDYRALDSQLSALSRRPEMAGLAVAVVEDGELRFVRA